MNKLLSLITRGWQKYTSWCDKMGLTENSQRCCMPRLQDPPLEKKPLTKDPGKSS